MKKYIVTLQAEEIDQLRAFVAKSRHTAKKVINTLILFNCNESQEPQGRRSELDIAQVLQVSERKIERVKRRLWKKAWRWRSMVRRPTASTSVQWWLRQVSVAEPDRVCIGDITSIAIDDGWLYLAVVIDLFSLAATACTTPGRRSGRGAGKNVRYSHRCIAYVPDDLGQSSGVNSSRLNVDTVRGQVDLNRRILVDSLYRIPLHTSHPSLNCRA
ncbi:MAG: hypothetical protein M3R45_14850 [Pseudomonadota bacterium]|nr:hypothetical protein [Pseudomonadota bacterium]